MNTEDRFWSKVDKSGDCWLWQGKPRAADGCGQFSVERNGRRGPVLVHRYVYETTYGEIPPLAEVERTCNHPLCVRPEHLRLMLRQKQVPPKPRPTFWENVGKSDGCWLWTGAIGSGGYGRFLGEAAHRWSYEQAYGPIPDGLWVLHRCDNPPCVRPDHLFLGTHQDNMDDMEQKGRQAMGERHGCARLAPEQVQAIRSRYAVGGVSYGSLAKEYDVSKATIGHIVSGRLWKHL